MQWHAIDAYILLTTVTLPAELLLALRENNADGLNLNIGLKKLGLEVIDELTRDFLMSPLIETEAERMPVK